MATIYAIASQKGGCGKTTTTENLAAALARRGKKVLVVDWDSQVSLTMALLYEGEGEVATVKADDHAFDLMVGDPTLAAQEFDSLDVLGKRLADYSDSYDYILIDCAPSLSMATMNALFCADRVIAPTQASFIAAAGVEELIGVVNTLNERGASIEQAKVLITMHERYSGIREMENEIREAYPTYETAIRRNVALMYAQGAGMDVFAYDPRSNGAADYDSLADEILAE